MNRDDFQCRVCCNTEKTLNVHHIIYMDHIKNAWEYENEYLITLCNECHEVEHNIIIKNLAFELIMDLVYISNDPISEIDGISVRAYFLNINSNYTRKEAIKMALLEYISKL